MNRVKIDFVQSCINYQFKNLQLLEQAFTRRSYSEEHPEAQNNEVLEFYGDEILDFFVTKMMYKRFSRIIGNELVSDKNEGELTKLKSILVSKESLARCMLNIGFSQFLYIGKSDEKNEVFKNKSVNEDLFEAIIGAVAADCDWNYERLEKLCRTMLNMETTNGYLALLVKEKSNRLGFGEPCYYPRAWQTEDPEEFSSDNLFNVSIGLECFGSTSKNPKTGKHEYGIQVGGNKFTGIGDGIAQAKLDAEKKAYHFLCQEEIKMQFQNLDYSNPASTLHELFQKKVLMEVRYEFNEYHDENGNPIWNCKAILEGYGIFEVDSESKKQAKQDAALKLLEFIAETKIEQTKEWEIPTFYCGLMRIRHDKGII